MFTDPQVAAVGLTEGEARGPGNRVRAVRVRLRTWPPRRPSGEDVTGRSRWWWTRPAR